MVLLRKSGFTTTTWFDYDFMVLLELNGFTATEWFYCILNGFSFCYMVLLRLYGSIGLDAFNANEWVYYKNSFTMTKWFCYD